MALSPVRGVLSLTFDNLGEAAELAGALAVLPGLEGSGVLMTISDNRLTVRLSRGVFRLESGARGPGAGGLGDC